MKPFNKLLRVNKVAQIRSEDTVGTTQSLPVVRFFWSLFILNYLGKREDQSASLASINARKDAVHLSTDKEFYSSNCLRQLHFYKFFHINSYASEL